MGTEDMWVVVLCGGMGTRLREETEFKPKPMVKIGEQPIIWHILKHYSFYGFKKFILALGYKGEMLKDYFINYQLMTNDFTVHIGESTTVTSHPATLSSALRSSFDVHTGHRAIATSHNGHPPEDWTIVLADTGANTLKGGRLKRIEHYVEGDRFMMTYGDGVASVDIPKLLAFHESHGRMCTVTGVIPTMRFGEVTTRPDGSVNFSEKQYGGAAMVNGGYYVLDRRIFDYVEDREDCDFEYGPLEKLADKHELMMYRHEGFWHCMDNIRDMEALNRMWASGTAPWKVW